jgi:MATE family multidrug resistance protein
MNRKILTLALPNIVTNISIPLLGMVDLGLMGHLSSQVYIGAIALGGMVFNFIFWGFGFLRMGSSGFTAQAYGGRDLDQATQVLVRSLFIALLGSLLLILLQEPIALLSFALIGGSKEVETLAREYFYIRIYAAPATIGLYAFMGWFIGMQNARIPMILAVSVNLLNIAFSLLFIKVFGMSSDGIALANVMSQTSGILLAIYFFRKYYSKLAKYINIRHAIRWSRMKDFLNVNKDIFIRTLCLIFTLSFFTTKSAREGDTLLAVNTLLFQFLYFFSYFIDGFAYAAEALVGKYTGAGDKVMVRKIVKRLFQWGFLLASAYVVIYLLFATHIL